MHIKYNRATELLERFERQSIVVVGDLILDRYIYGGVERISPEAPVPVVCVSREEYRSGGASNVACNITALGGEACMVCVVGKDQHGEELKSLLLEEGVGVSGILMADDLNTTVKTRIVAERQQLVRVDWDNRTDVVAGHIPDLCERLDDEIGKSTGVIMEDYGKGVVDQQVVTRAIAGSRKKGVPSGFDPKDNHVLDVTGVTVATPNRQEAFGAVGRKDVSRSSGPPAEDAFAAVGQALLAKWNPEHLMITLGPHGIYLLSQGEAPRHVPTRAREVFDVSGAGDTVIAVCLLALSAGANFYEAAELANAAAGVVVGKLGTATCAREELLASIG